MIEKNDTEKTPFCFVSLITLGSAALIAAASFLVVFRVTDQVNHQMFAYQAKSGFVSLLGRSAYVSDLSLAASGQGNWEWTFEALPEYDPGEIDGGDENEFSSDPIPVALKEGPEADEIKKDVQSLLAVDDFSFDSIARQQVPVASCTKPAPPAPEVKPTVEAPQPIPATSGPILIEPNKVFPPTMPAPLKASEKTL